MVSHVAAPATISVRTVDPRSLILKYRSRAPPGAVVRVRDPVVAIGVLLSIRAGEGRPTDVYGERIERGARQRKTSRSGPQRDQLEPHRVDQPEVGDLQLGDHRQGQERHHHEGRIEAGPEVAGRPPRRRPNPRTKPNPIRPLPVCRSITATLARSRSGSATASPSRTRGSSIKARVTISPGSIPITRTRPPAGIRKAPAEGVGIRTLSRIHDGASALGTSCGRPRSATSRPRFHTETGRSATRSSTATTSATEPGARAPCRRSPW